MTLTLDFLSGGGELGERMRELDWKSSALGPPEAWPQSLRSALSICLNSRFPIAIYWGPELSLLYNDSWSSIPGEKHPWALGRRAREVWPEIWDSIGPLFERVQASGEGVWQQNQLLAMHRHGYTEECYFNFTFSPVRSEDGAVAGIFNAVIETTSQVIGERRERILRALAERTALARSAGEVCELAANVLSNAPEDLPFALLYLSNGEKTHLKLAATAGVGISALIAPPTADPETFKEFWLSGPQPNPGTLMLVSDLRPRTGAELKGVIWPEPLATAVVLPITALSGSETVGFLIAGVSPRRAVDREYQTFFERLSSQLSTALAAAAAYDEERRRAEGLAELDRAKTTFFSNISHEFRTPLTLMLGPLEDALNDAAEVALPDLQQQRIEIAHRNSVRLLKLVNTLLDFSRIEAGRFKARYQATDLAELTADLASNFQSATSRAGVDLRIDCQPLAHVVYVDRDLYEKIVLNLVSNAFKFTFEGTIAVSTRVSDDGNAAEIFVQDTGVGIPEYELPNLFERFHRVAGQKSRSFEGSGIGLALVQELVKLHGGTIHVDSRVGEGSTFKISLPFGTSHLSLEQVEPESSDSSRSPKAGAYVQEAMGWLPGADTDFAESIADRPDSLEITFDRELSQAHILIVDDNEDMRRYIGRLLGPKWEVSSAPNGRIALEMILHRKPDLVLSDVMMPELDGFGLLKALRSELTLKDLPVILLSARAGEEARVEGLDAGADDYLTKPFVARELIARINANLAMARVRRDSILMLQEANDTLEVRIKAALTQQANIEAQLRQAQKMEAVGRLTGGVAHDFNNLLQVVSGNLQLLAREISAEGRGAQRLKAAQTALDRGAKLSSQLLAFARRQPMAPKVANLGRVLRGFDEMLRRALGEGIELETIIGGGLWNTFVDAALLENAVLNLAINARDAMKGRGKLTIEAGNSFLDADYAARHQEVTVGQYVMLAVTDTGHGIPAEVIDQVFEPFFTTKPEGQGTGLGLSMVYGFVKQSGGHVKIYSEAGQGTTVRLYLPRSRANEDLEVNTEAGPATGGTETVLVVEDDEGVRDIVVEMLTDLGYRVLKSNDAQSALAVIDSGMPIDLLFTDVVMPGTLRSPELARRARERLPCIAVLFTSGYTQNAIVHGGRLDDGIELLSKPYSREALARKVRHVLRNQQQASLALRPVDGFERIKGPVKGEQRSSQLRVLVVEDDSLIRELTVSMLEELGHRVLEAEDGTKALRLLDQEVVDVLMTDISLPGISGLELIQRATAKAPHLAVIVASGYDPLSANARYGNLASAEFLRKPYDQKTLADALARIRGGQD